LLFSCVQLPTDLTASFAATYTTANGESRCARCDVVLPLTLVALPIPTVKSPGFKVTVEINRPPPPLTSLFEDLLAGNPELADGINNTGGGF